MHIPNETVKERTEEEQESERKRLFWLMADEWFKWIGYGPLNVFHYCAYRLYFIVLLLLSLSLSCLSRTNQSSNKHIREELQWAACTENYHICTYLITLHGYTPQTTYTYRIVSNCAAWTVHMVCILWVASPQQRRQEATCTPSNTFLWLGVTFREWYSPSSLFIRMIDGWAREKRRRKQCHAMHMLPSTVVSLQYMYIRHRTFRMVMIGVRIRL